jgi:integrase
VKGGTATVYGHTKRCLIEFFGAGKPIAEITAGEADDWRRWLVRPKNEDEPKKGGQGLSDNTCRRRCGLAKQFFRDALRRRLIAENPFADMKGTSVLANRSRDYFVSREEADKVIAACPDAQWKLLFALSRYGGLRCPSEHLALTWGDVNWRRERITVHSPKTAHHEGHEERMLPLFPELRPYLQAVLDELLEDFDPKAHRLSEQPIITRYRDTNANLRTQLQRIIKAAGLTAWPKLFQNLRSTRQTELREHYPDHVVCSWIGNSHVVAAKHYLQTTEEHFEKAAAEPTGALQKALLKPADNGRSEAHEEKSSEENSLDCASVRPIALEGVGDAGLEPATSTL